ncbi:MULTISPECIES: DUF421 domain-containing protein [Rothia]|nr:YetF domain-containing protein [Rothia kristinae]TDP53623.1 uncharacterized protein DUF421 [Kocuria sp. AG109]SIL97886.1 membrane protein [Mycobacteroides abscessus subsp. abscessus]MCA1170456.1 DUF421 domain-containing protein [Rothia kristinae]MCT1358002.1 DUF421 domain-containing protein [Rothia kristinae]MCT1393317.1 DUF421 domain-containing protein [Rothia kristinae]
MSLPPDLGHLVWRELGIEPWRIPVVIAAAVGIYLCFVLLVRVFGVRLLSSWNGLDALIIIMFGAVAGRVILGNHPTLGAGIVGLGTLIFLEILFGTLQRVSATRRLRHQPLALMAHGEFLERSLRRAHLTHREICAALRAAGITRLDQVRGVILEDTGHLSILRTGTEPDPALLDGVRGAELILAPAARDRDDDGASR